MGYFDLTGQTAIVTGAATGIGEAIARRLANAGATVAVADLNLDGASEVAASIGLELNQMLAAIVPPTNVMTTPFSSASSESRNFTAP